MYLNYSSFQSLAVLCMLYVFFWVIPRLHLPAYDDGTECSETSAYKIQTPANYPEENVQHVWNNLKNSEISLDISREFFFCPAVGWRLDIRAQPSLPIVFVVMDTVSSG